MSGHLLAVVYAPFATGFFLSYTTRSINAVIAGDLARDVGLSAADLGLLSAAYFIAVAAMQLPLGLMLDRFGPRRVQAALLGVAGAGSALFAVGDDALTLTLGRGLIGIGFAGGLMASLKAFVLWFPRERLGLVNSSIFALGGVGALLATVPADAFAEAFGWRAIFWVLCLSTWVASAAIYFVVPEKITAASPQTFGEALKGLLEIYRDPVFLRVAPLSSVVAGSFQALQSLWAGPWLRDVAGLERADVAFGLFSMSLALTIGHLGMALAADKLMARGFKITSIVATGALILIAVQICLAARWSEAWLGLWICFGLLGNISALGFTAFGQYFPPERVGRANTAMNVFMFSFAFVAQSTVGWIIHFWPETPSGGYEPAGYGAAFGALIAAQIAAFAWFLRSGRKRS